MLGCRGSWRAAFRNGPRPADRGTGRQVDQPSGERHARRPDLRIGLTGLRHPTAQGKPGDSEEKVCSRRPLGAPHAWTVLRQRVVVTTVTPDQEPCSTTVGRSQRCTGRDEPVGAAGDAWRRGVSWPHASAGGTGCRAAGWTVSGSARRSVVADREKDDDSATTAGFTSAPIRAADGAPAELLGDAGTLTVEPQRFVIVPEWAPRRRHQRLRRPSLRGPPSVRADLRLAHAQPGAAGPQAQEGLGRHGRPGHDGDSSPSAPSPWNGGGTAGSISPTATTCEPATRAVRSTVAAAVRPPQCSDRHRLPVRQGRYLQERQLRSTR